jgi:hypothetical protein
MVSERRDTALEARLTALGSALEWPETRDVSGSVRARIEGVRPAARRPFPVPSVAFGVAIAIIALVAAALALFPGARQAVADWLGISGIEIRVREDVPTPSTSVKSIDDLDLGEEVSLAEAQEAVDFPLQFHDETDSWPPRVFLRKAPAPAVSFVYASGPDLPRSEQTGVGMLLTQFRGRYSPDLVKKVSATSTVEPVVVGDGGFWLEGRPHSVLFRDEDGNIYQDRMRLAGNTLIWEEDGVSFRLEADIERDQALQIARGLE